MKNDRSQHAKEWFVIGDNEFGFACLGLKDEEDKFYAQICFLFQQVIEKYLKGYLVAHNIKPARIHDLNALCQKCAQINKGFEQFLESCEIVSQYYIPSRYPTHWPICSPAATKDAHKIAKEIISFIKEELKLN